MANRGIAWGVGLPKKLFNVKRLDPADLLYGRFLAFLYVYGVPNYGEQAVNIAERDRHRKLY